MLATRTFLDTSILIAAWKGSLPEAKALAGDSKRAYIASDFLYLEVMPKAVYNKQRDEIEFYRTYFDTVRIWIRDTEETVTIAREEAERCGLAAMDALHVAAAFIGEAEILYTLESPTKPIHRTSLVHVICPQPR